MLLVFLIVLTASNTVSVFIPASRAILDVLCITGPSARGSEKGIPISIISAPQLSRTSKSLSVPSRSGNPHVINGINAFRPFFSILQILLRSCPVYFCFLSFFTFVYYLSGFYQYHLIKRMFIRLFNLIRDYYQYPCLPGRKDLLLLLYPFQVLGPVF